MNQTDIIVVLTHVPDQNCALRIANALIEAKLAACVNIGSAVQSVYEWEGQVETTTEFSIQIKAKQSAYQDIEKLILAYHPYELPDIIVLNVIGGLEQYLQWVRKENNDENR